MLTWNISCLADVDDLQYSDGSGTSPMRLFNFNAAMKNLIELAPPRAGPMEAGKARQMVLGSARSPYERYTSTPELQERSRRFITPTRSVKQATA